VHAEEKVIAVLKINDINDLMLRHAMIHIYMFSVFNDYGLFTNLKKENIAQ
jgi:hypothetical protein